RASAAAHLSLGLLCHQVARHPDATGHYERALALSRQSGWTAGESASLTNLGYLFLQMGRLPEAVGRVQEALALERATGDLPAQAVGLANLGLMDAELGQLDHAGAVDEYEQAMHLGRAGDGRWQEALALTGLARVLHRRGDPGRAATVAADAVALTAAAGFRVLEGQAREAAAATALHHGDLA